MAALAGVLFPDPPGDPEVVRRMLEAVPHRGSELEVASLGRCIVGVVNETDRREASLAARDGFVVAFTGVLDNPDEISGRLPRPDHTGRAMNPAERVLAAFEESGESMLPSLRGNFGCVVSDGRRLWAFRDQIGFESLFERVDSRSVYVATEAKQVLAGAGIAPEPDVELVEALFYGDVEDSTACPLRGVRRLLPGIILAVDGDLVTRRRYWDPADLVETARLSPSEVAERFRELFTQAVRRTLTGSDVVALSGGIDSPPIAAFGDREHRRLFARPLPALAEVYPSYPSADETRYIELVADRLDIPLHTYEPGRQRLDRLQDWVKLFDGPWSTVAPEGTSQRCREARRLGHRTLLTGHFAEFVTSAGQGYLVPHLVWRGRIRAATAQLAAQRRAGAGRRRLARELVETFTPKFVHRRRMLQWRQFDMIPPWVEIRRITEREAKTMLPIRRRWRSFQLPFYGGGTSGEADIYSHAVHGIRPRRPWADLDLWEFFISLPAEVKFPDHRMKGLLRTVLRPDVPDEILDRRDKTTTNEYFRSMCLDLESLRRWLLAPTYRVSGVDYARLAEDLSRKDMSLAHYLWARDLAAVHAFLDLWK
jgi:asparagine synthetase B (glutamine-hydrolysing)